MMIEKRSDTLPIIPQLAYITSRTLGEWYTFFGVSYPFKMRHKVPICPFLLQQLYVFLVKVQKRTK